MKTQTLADIAKVFGVSPVTISYALRGAKGVSPTKAKEIRDYAESVGYRPAHMARSLLRGYTDIVGLCLTKSPRSPWIAGLLHLFQEHLRKEKLYLAVAIADQGNESVTWALEYFQSIRAEAVVLGPLAFADDYYRVQNYLNGIPCVMAFDTMESLPVPHVRLDLYNGARKAVEHLVRRGHRRIGYIGVWEREMRVTSIRSRYLGFCDAMNRHGLKPDPGQVFSWEEGEPLDMALRRFDAALAAGAKQPTAYFCHNDDHALRAIRLLANHGYRVPDDVSIIGFDNHPMTEMMIPSVTTIGFDLDAYIHGIAESVIQRIQAHRKNKPAPDENGPICREELQPQLFIRESVRQI